MVIYQSGMRCGGHICKFSFDSFPKSPCKIIVIHLILMNCRFHSNWHIFVNLSWGNSRFKLSDTWYSMFYPYNGVTWKMLNSSLFLLAAMKWVCLILFMFWQVCWFYSRWHLFSHRTVYVNFNQSLHSFVLYH